MYFLWVTREVTRRWGRAIGRQCVSLAEVHSGDASPILYNGNVVLVLRHAVLERVPGPGCQGRPWFWRLGAVLPVSLLPWKP